MIGTEDSPRRAAILSLTGGGIMGRYTTEILEFVENIRSRVVGTDNRESPIGEAFDVIAGTSAGALIAAGIASGRNAKKLSGLFDEFGPKIFPKKSGFTKAMHWRSAFYRTAALEEAIEIALPRKDILLGELNHHLIVPSFDEEAGEPVVYSSRTDSHQELRLKNVILASAAAPIYFPARRVFGRRHIDGGLFANAPDLAAVNAVSERWPGLSLNDIDLLSVGTTIAPSESPVSAREAGDWGIFRWGVSPALRLLQITLHAQVAHQMELLPRLGLGNFVRIDSDLTPEQNRILSLDNASDEAMSLLKDLAEERMCSPRFKEHEVITKIATRNRWT